MEEKKNAYMLKVSALGTVCWILAIIIAIKMGKKFWPVVGYSILGSMLGTGIGYLIFKYPEDTQN